MGTATRGQLILGDVSAASTPFTHSGLSEEFSSDVDQVFLQQPLLVGNLLQMLGLISILLHLPVQHLQHRFQLVLHRKGQRATG